MPLFTALVLATGPGKGKVSHYQLGAGTWGRKEGLPKFEKIEIEAADSEEMQHLLLYARYDFQQSKWRRKKTGEDFDPNTDVIRKVDDYSDVNELNNALCEMIIENPSGNACDDLLPFWLNNGDEMRPYWMERMYPHRKLAGMKKFMQTVKYGSYGHTRKVVRQMTAPQRQAFLAVLTADELRYMKAICLATTPQEYQDYLAGN